MTASQTTFPIRTTSYVDLDFTSEAPNADTLLIEAREYATSYAHVPADEVTVAVVTMRGPAGGWPVVRFMAEQAWLEQLVEVYDDER